MDEIDALIHTPGHYLEGRTIEPVEVMESWGLIQSHYLACAFKYIARGGRKGDVVQDLKKPFGIWSVY